MAFNVEKHANLGFIDREVKEMVEEMRVYHTRHLKGELEYIIRESYRLFKHETEHAQKQRLREQKQTVNK